MVFISALCKAAVSFDGWNRGLNKTCASTVVDVISDNGNGFGSNERGSVMYFMNPESTIQPGCWAPNCNHQMCIQFFYATFHPNVSRNANKFRGERCKQTRPGCKTDHASSKLSSFSGQENGCFCVKTDECYTYDSYAFFFAVLNRAFSFIDLTHLFAKKNS